MMKDNYPWTEEQAEALWASVEHWLENWEDPLRAKIFGDDCPCCALWSSDEEMDCVGCPVMEHTGKPDCFNTPWYAAHDERRLLCPSDDMRGVLRAFAAEYRFLVELALGERGPVEKGDE
jgi:hypothetical protein